MPFSNVSIVSADFMSFKDWSKEILGISSARKKMAVNLLEAGMKIRAALTTCIFEGC